MIRIFIPQDSAAKAVGADKVAAAVARELTVRGLENRATIIRNSSRGLFWLEPLVEIEIDGVRHGYGPVSAKDVPSLFEAGFLEGKPHRLALGPVEDIPSSSASSVSPSPMPVNSIRWTSRLSRGRRLCRSGKGAGARPAETVETVFASGLRGRGGAGFPTGIKWRTAAAAKAQQKYIVCNADEGDSGTFADRMVMEGDPFSLIEGMTIAGIAVGAAKAIATSARNIRMRSASWRRPSPSRAPKAARPKVNGSAHAFDIEIRVGAGAYVCGEETALLESIEGKRGQVRAKPPIPALTGLFGQPTIINNVLTLASVPFILREGAQAYQEVGFGRSRGTIPIQLAGNIRHGGLFETGFGISLGELVNDIGGGTVVRPPGQGGAGGRPSGRLLPACSVRHALRL